MAKPLNQPTAAFLLFIIIGVLPKLKNVVFTAQVVIGFRLEVGFGNLVIVLHARSIVIL